MGGVLSEGIAFPLKDIPLVRDFMADGSDVTKLIGIVKYDPEALQEEADTKAKALKSSPLVRFLMRIPFLRKFFLPKRSGGWPSFVSKTDETRIQNLTYVFDKWQGKRIYITEKIDGQSATFAYKGGEFYVCSRNVLLSKERIKAKPQYKGAMSKYLATAKNEDIATKLKKYKKDTGHDIYIQGEQCGPGIQGNKYGFEMPMFFVFNVYDITAKRYFDGNEVRNFCIEYGFNMVPVLSECFFAWPSVEEMVEYSKGKSKYGDTPREGVVVRTRQALPPEHGMSNQSSFKCINPDFLIKYSLE
jgi:RNA ligase (TIGR02306 family)